MSTPPSTGPSAAPSTATFVQSVIPASRPPMSPPSSAIDAGSTSAAPSPWTQRKAISIGRFTEAAQPTDAAVKSTSPTCATRRGSSRREKTATTAAAIATTRLYEVITHETPTSVVSNAP